MNNESRALRRDSLDIASTHESWHQNWHHFIPSTESWAVLETTNTSCQAASDVGNNILDLTVVSWTIDAGESSQLNARKPIVSLILGLHHVDIMFFQPVSKPLLHLLEHLGSANHGFKARNTCLIGEVIFSCP